MANSSHLGHFLQWRCVKNKKKSKNLYFQLMVDLQLYE